jgi:hypothetical protein
VAEALIRETGWRKILRKRLLYRPLTGTTETQSIGIARATKGDVTPAGEKFCEILRRLTGTVRASPVSKVRTDPILILLLINR